MIWNFWKKIRQLEERLKRMVATAREEMKQ